MIQTAKESEGVKLLQEHIRNNPPSEPLPIVAQAIARATRNNPKTPQDVIVDDILDGVGKMRL